MSDYPICFTPYEGKLYGDYLVPCEDTPTPPNTDLFDVIQDNPLYLDRQLITYIGNKRRLLPFIEQGIQEAKKRLGKANPSLLDLFAGSGVVSRLAKAHCSHLHTNDIETYSRIINECYLSNRDDLDIDLLQKWHSRVIDGIEENWAPGFIRRLYAPKDDQKITSGDRAFYTIRNATFLDTARREISKVPKNLQCYFLGPLLSEASIHANTAGVFKGFYKDSHGVGQFGGSGEDALQRILEPIKLDLPVLSSYSTNYEVTQRDANDLVGELGTFDIAYIDPPYNQHPYGSNYFMLNLIATYEEPLEVSKVAGIPSDWRRSDYNKRQKAEATLFDVVSRCPARILLISYNSEGFIPHERFLSVLESISDVMVFDTKYNTFRGSRNLHARDMHVREYLYLVQRD